jgi:hypothetical protein
MRKAFLEFLVNQGIIRPEQPKALQHVLRGVPEPIGSIAFSYGMITGADIDGILDEQRENYRPFGEIAIDRRLLTREQVETLLGVQRIKAATDIAEALALSGVCTMDQIVPRLGQFLTQHLESLAGTAG